MNSVKNNSIACDKNGCKRMLPVCKESRKKKSNVNKKVKDVSSKLENNHLCLALNEELNHQLLKR